MNATGTTKFRVDLHNAGNDSALDLSVARDGQAVLTRGYSGGWFTPIGERAAIEFEVSKTSPDVQVTLDSGWNQ
jgi:hypothetical protein